MGSACVTSDCRASVVLFRITFASHLSVTHGPCIQASLTLNLARADSNFCLQITFQWLHKSAASSSASFSLPLAFLPPLLYLPLSMSAPPPFAPFLHQPHLIFFPRSNFHPLSSFSASISSISSSLLLLLPVTCFLVSSLPPPPSVLLVYCARSVNEKQGGRDGEVTCVG